MTAQTTTTTAAVTMTGGDVLEALAAVRPALSRRRNAHPWERSVWLLVSREGAQLRCNTGEVSASVDFDAQCEENERMSAHVDAQTLQQALQTHATRRGKGAATVLEVSVDEGRLTIATSGAAATSTVPLLDPENMLGEYPAARLTLVAERDRFVGDITAAAVCAETGAQALPILTGIHLDNGKIQCTDRYRLAAFDLDGSGELPEVTVPATPFAKMLKATTGDEVLIGADGERVSVHADNIRFTIRAIEGDYPKVDKIVGDRHGLPTMTLQRQATINLLTPYTKGTHTVSITPQDRDLLLEIYGDADEPGAPIAATTMPKGSGDDLEHPLAFNVGYLHDVLTKAHTGPTVAITSAGPLKPAGISSAAPGRTVMLQPVRFATP